MTRKSSDKDDELLTPDDVEERFKMAKSTQAAMRSRRQIPFILIGPRMPRYRRSEIVAWLADRAMPEQVRGTKGGR